MNYKTTALGVLTILAALATAGKEFLSTGNIPDLGIVVAAVAAGWGLIAARDAQN
jgi:hypothetical protein